MIFEHWQALCHDHFPEKLIPVLDHPLSEELSPKIRLAQQNILQETSLLWYMFATTP